MAYKKDKYAEQLSELKDKMRGLVTVMQLNQRELTFEEGQEVQNIEFLMEHALKELVGKTRLEEAKLKLKAMEDTLAVVKAKPAYDKEIIATA